LAVIYAASYRPEERASSATGTSDPQARSSDTKISHPAVPILPLIAAA
jgi:hypothetical protein